jgi:cytochrome c5
VATGQLPLAADRVAEHNTAHAVAPPEAGATPEFGRHVAAVCTGCHRENLGGGPIVGGDPAWVPARNLTPHAEGLANWTYEQFVAAMREGKRPDGTSIQAPMTLIMPYAQRMTDTELQGLWAYLRSVPAHPTNQ